MNSNIEFKPTNLDQCVTCDRCEYLQIINSDTLYAVCRQTGFEFKPFGADTRRHTCGHCLPCKYVKAAPVANDEPEPTEPQPDMTWARKTVYCERPQVKVLGIDLSAEANCENRPVFKTEIFDACM